MVKVPSLADAFRQVDSAVKAGKISSSSAADLKIKIQEKITGMSQSDFEPDSTSRYKPPAAGNIFSGETIVTAKDSPVVGEPGKAWGLPGLYRLLKEFQKNATDSSALFNKLADDFFKSNKKLIFSQNGPGEAPGFKDLSPATKAIKAERRDFGSAIGVLLAPITGEETRGVYPILVKSGDLMRSLTTGSGTTIRVVTGKEFKLGTAEPHAGIHQDGARNALIVARDEETGRTGMRRFGLAKRPPVQFKVGNREKVWSKTLAQGITAIRGRKLN